MHRVVLFLLLPCHLDHSWANICCQHFVHHNFSFFSIPCLSLSPFLSSFLWKHGCSVNLLGLNGNQSGIDIARVLVDPINSVWPSILSLIMEISPKMTMHTVYRQLKVVIPASCGYIQTFWTCTSSKHLDQGTFQDKSHILVFLSEFVQRRS